MKKKQRSKSRVNITVETERTVLIRSPRACISFCADCGRPVQMVTPEQATILTGIRARTIYQDIEATKIHFLETPAGLLLVCLDSLAQRRPGPGQILFPPR